MLVLRPGATAVWVALVFLACSFWGATAKVFQPVILDPLAEDHCPSSCSDVFQKLEEGTQSAGGRVQRVEVEERGEPKSGTGFMMEWGTFALAHSCMYLQRAYGDKSCWIDWDFLNRTMIFEPSRAAAAPGPCACHDVKMAAISLSNRAKHVLPVEESCGYSHKKGIASVTDQVCTPPGGGIRPGNNAQLSECFRESDCRVKRDRLQMSVMRDPRSIAVSTYFHILRKNPSMLQSASVDEYVMEFLPAACKWLSIRYLLFAGILADNSSFFWYEDAEDDPMGWHETFYDLVGLRIPLSEVTTASAFAAGLKLDERLACFPSRGLDVHIGGVEDPTAKRTFRDEVSPSTLLEMDDVLRTWLPPVLLERLGVSSF